MKAWINESGGKRARRSTIVAASLSLFLVSFACRAQAVQQIVVQGKDSTWKLVGTVEPLTAFQIGAKGSVDFGGLFQKDDANAGVTGNAFAKYAEEVFSSGIKALIDYLLSADVSNDSGSGSTSSSLSSVGRAPMPMHWNWVDYININGGTVNYDEGAFFVMITTSAQQSKQSNTPDELDAGCARDHSHVPGSARCMADR